MAQDTVTATVQLVVIGGSAGSLDVILKLIPSLQPVKPFAIILVTHRKPASDDILVELLDTKTSWTVKEAEEKEPIMPNVIYVAPADYHLLIEKDRTFALDVSEKVNYSRPSIDITFEAAAEVYGPSLVAILLSGANADGVEGLQEAKKLGAVCVAQDPASAEVSYMPQQAVDNVAIDKILRPEELTVFINGLS